MHPIGPSPATSPTARPACRSSTSTPRPARLLGPEPGRGLGPRRRLASRGQGPARGQAGLGPPARLDPGQRQLPPERSRRPRRPPGPLPDPQPGRRPGRDLGVRPHRRLRRRSDPHRPHRPLRRRPDRELGRRRRGLPPPAAVRPRSAGWCSLDTEGYDVDARIRGGGRAALLYRNAFGNDPAVWRDASPVNHVDATDAPQLVIRRGTLARQRGQAAYAQAFRDAGVPVTVVPPRATPTAT